MDTNRYIRKKAGVNITGFVTPLLELSVTAIIRVHISACGMQE